jgi:hypothetical protein
MWDEIKNKIIQKADWIFLVLLSGFILSFFSDARSAGDLRLIYLFAFIALVAYLLFRWILKLAKKGKDFFKSVVWFFFNVASIAGLVYVIYRLPDWLSPVSELRLQLVSYVREVLAPVKPVFNVLDRLFDIGGLVVGGIIFLVLSVCTIVWMTNKFKILSSPGRQRDHLDK